MLTTRMLMLSCVLAILACKTKEPEAPSLDEKMRHCPVAVDGARTELVDDDAGIRLIVTAPTPEGAGEIRRRVKHLAELTSGKNTGVKHGGGQGGGWMRDCPVVTKDTRIAGTDIEGGSTISVAAVDPAQKEALRNDTRERYAKFLKR